MNYRKLARFTKYHLAVRDLLKHRLYYYLSAKISWGILKSDNIIELLLREELRVANKHLPSSRKSLRELLEEEYPHVLCRDGTPHFFRRRELEAISRLIEREKWEALLLPIIITVMPESKIFMGVVEDEYAVEVISKILGLEYRGSKLFLYKPQLYELRKAYSTIFQLAISYTGTLSEETSKGFETT